VKAAAVAWAALALAADSGSWKPEVDPSGLRRTEVAGEARLGETRTPARLALQCRPGVKGALVWSLQVEHAAKLDGFRFDDFEGPDAVALEQALSELSIEGGLMQPKVKARQSGFFHGDQADSFVFEVAAEAGAGSDASLLADAIGPTTTAITWTVTSARDVKQHILARFPAQGAAEAVRRTMSGCGPAPELGDELAAAWQGKDPAIVLDQRAVDWRLQALLGRDYDAFRAALAKAEPIGTSGSMLYLMGRGEDGSAAAWYVDRKGGLGEAVLIRHRKPERFIDEDAPRLVAPIEVREFIAKAMAG